MIDLTTHNRQVPCSSQGGATIFRLRFRFGEFRHFYPASVSP